MNKTCEECMSKTGFHVCAICEANPAIKKQTNADKIRAMTDEELAVFLSQTEEHLFTGNLWSIKTWNEWLKKEVEDG